MNRSPDGYSLSRIFEHVWQDRRESKGREAREIQERDEAGNLLALYTQDHEAYQLKDLCPGLSLVEPESRTAIGTRGQQASLPAGREDGGREHRGDGRSSLVPDGTRRHGEPGVLSQQRYEARDIGLLPQGDIAVKEFLDARARRSHQGLTCDVVLLHSTSGSLQGGIDGGNREVEPFGHFTSFPREHLAQEQNGPLRWG